MSKGKRIEKKDTESEKQLAIFLDRFNEEFDKLGKSPKEVALEIPISQSSISQYRNRNIKSLPTMKSIEKIARYFGVNSNYLLGKSKTPNYEHEDIMQKTGLSKKAYQILKSVKNTDLIDTINYLIEQEEVFLLDGFTPIYNKKEDSNKTFEKALENYEKELKKIDNNCIPILSTIHNYYSTQITNEDMYVIDNTLKKLKDFEWKVERHLAKGKISTKNIVDNAYLEEIENQLRNSKTKYQDKKGVK
ncbi:MAG: helix-turn-helix domain-containing protein [Candidatus Scatovivens sp.]